MRIKLNKGKQQKLIRLAKQKYIWRELSKKLDVSEGYLRNELQHERRLLSEELYKKICKLINMNFNKFIIEKLDDNWGRTKGGHISKKKIKKIKNPKKDGNLAEIIGIILGDGHICELISGNKIRCYFIRIAGNYVSDKDYLIEYIPNLFKQVFNEGGSLHFSKKSKVGYFTVYGKNYIKLMKSLGIKPGNKKKNNQGIPSWIKNNKKYLIKCIKGLIDTDGSIHYISKRNLNLRISYTSYIPKLLKEVREGLIKIGFTPSKIISKKQIFLSRQKDIKNYIKEIGFGNQKNLNRLKFLKSRNAPVV